MPTFDFHCPTCNRYEEAYVHSWRDEYHCAGCGAGMEKVWSLGVGHSAISSFPFTTTHLSGKPETFSSQSELNRRLKEVGMAQRDDASYVDEVYRGYDWGKKEQTYSSGRGAKGSWF